MRKIEAIILANETPEDHKSWSLACKERAEFVNHRVVDLTKNNWLEEIQNQPFDVLLAKPGGLTTVYKQLYDERIYILNKVLCYLVYPSAEEIFIYESKRFLSYWLKANQIPHPRTFIFYNYDEASHFLTTTNYPIVAKSNLGASGSGVVFLPDVLSAKKYLLDIFAGKRAVKRWGPNLAKGGILRRGMHYLFNPRDIRKRINIYRVRKNNSQQEFVFFQEYIPHQFEWRVVRIGDSFFAHKKWVKNGKASGSLLKIYDNPPFDLLDFVKKITDRFGFHSQAIDVFETSSGKYLVNEMQCIFGQSDPYQMLVNDKPGRYQYIDSKWIFEEGLFNSNQCFDLRLDYLINKISNERR